MVQLTPTHPGLVSVKTFVEAQQVALVRNRSRSRPGRTAADTKQPYVLRSYITCVECERRMFGKNDRGRLYYVCSPKRSHLPDGHPAVIRIREEPLLEGLSEFFNREVFGPHRRERLETLLVRLDDRHLREYEAHVIALETKVADLGPAPGAGAGPARTTG